MKSQGFFSAWSCSVTLGDAYGRLVGARRRSGRARNYHDSIVSMGRLMGYTGCSILALFFRGRLRPLDASMDASFRVQRSMS